MHRCEIWTIKKAEHWRTDTFKLWCWRRLLRVPWTARRSNQSILKEINLEYSLEGLLLKLKLSTVATWCEELTHLKRPWCWERLKAKGERGSREWDGYIESVTQWTWIWSDSGRYWKTEEPSTLQSMGLQRRTWLSDWTEPNQFQCLTNQTDWFYIFLSKRRYNSLLFSLGKKEGITHTK